MSTPTILHVFDFDGTIFGSPPPPPDFTGRPGDWWSSVDSLSEPNVPDVPSSWWYNTSVVQEARRSIADPNVYSVLMTGRPTNNAALRYRVAELLKIAGLSFADVWLKTGANTESFKAQKIKWILGRNPSIKEAHFWDDRVHHLPMFGRMAEEMGVAAVPHPVTRFERTGRPVHEVSMSLSTMLLEAPERREKFQMDLPVDLHPIAKFIRSKGGELYVVGGAVRDTLLGKEPKDYDLATDLPPDQIISLFQGQPGLKIDLTGKDFGVVRIWTPEGNEYEIATFREDLGDGRRPDAVRWATIEDDVKRRDLTVNALFFDIDKGEIVDLVGGIDDLQNGIIRAVGEPSQRFEEDPLRTLRAIRFAARMGSELDPETSRAVAAVASRSLSGVSADRIQDEFVKGIKSAVDPAQYVELAKTHNLLQHIFPGLAITTTAVPRSDLAVQLATMLLGNNPKAVQQVFAKMRFKSAVSNQTAFLLRFAELSTESAPAFKKEARRYKIADEQMRQFARAAGAPESRATEAFINFSKQPPAASPRDLMAQGIQGAELGKALSAAETEAFANLLGEARRATRVSLALRRKIISELV